VVLQVVAVELFLVDGHPVVVLAVGGVETALDLDGLELGLEMEGGGRTSTPRRTSDRMEERNEEASESAYLEKCEQNVLQHGLSRRLLASWLKRAIANIDLLNKLSSRL
jgi:hypothetical protein